MKIRIQGIVFSAMTIHLLAVLCMCLNFWLKTKYMSLHTPLLNRFSACDDIFFQNSRFH